MANISKIAGVSPGSFQKISSLLFFSWWPQKMRKIEPWEFWIFDFKHCKHIQTWVNTLRGVD
jgi:hypothetical protein